MSVPYELRCNGAYDLGGMSLSCMRCHQPMLMNQVRECPWQVRREARGCTGGVTCRCDDIKALEAALEAQVDAGMKRGGPGHVELSVSTADMVILRAHCAPPPRPPGEGTIVTTFMGFRVWLNGR